MSVRLRVIIKRTKVAFLFGRLKSVFSQARHRARRPAYAKVIATKCIPAELSARKIKELTQGAASLSASNATEPAAQSAAPEPEAPVASAPMPSDRGMPDEDDHVDREKAMACDPIVGVEPADVPTAVAPQPVKTPVAMTAGKCKA